MKPVDDCKLCYCMLFEKKKGCTCMCHVALDKLMEMEHGNKAKIMRDLKEERETGNPFYMPGVGVGMSMNIDEVIDLLKKVKEKGGQGPTLKIGGAIEGSDPSKMSAGDLIDYEIYIGMQKNVLPQGFIIDQGSREELIRAVNRAGPDTRNRVDVCISYLQGYNKGYRLGRYNERGSRYGV